MTTWRRTPIDPPNCDFDGCGETATAAYLLPDQCETKDVILGCSLHAVADAAYPVSVARWTDPDDFTERQAVQGKYGGVAAAAMVDDRLYGTDDVESA